MTTAPPWIAFTDRWPDKGSVVLVFGRDYGGTRERYDVVSVQGHAFKPGTFLWDSHADQLRHEITHWMPLPDQPSGDA